MPEKVWIFLFQRIHTFSGILHNRTTAVEFITLGDQGHGSVFTLS